MRTLRTTVVAAASVAALTLGTSAAVAAETPNANNSSSTTTTGAQENNGSSKKEENAGAQENNGSSKKDENADNTNSGFKEGGTGSSKIGARLDADKPADGQAIFGSSKDLNSQPAWAKLVYALTWLGGIGSFLGLIAGPLYNFAVHGLPQIKF
ncbi:hypothetical protein [Corynebacterium renale]|uniref:Secreted protein n=1 Tax=Corynebacterium renale TaxID=1724 RepID=A0A2A9DRG9_9CORY|nr:hypothetical protein [Corynebacterium renale]PFG28510.1 hypothetical protein ATK06_1621 [Corynebacterium renale]SQI26275.1 or membrane protein [Corynebacterium renale]